jgi:hypothetical protein
MAEMNRWDQVSGQTPVADGLGKQFTKVMLPTVDGGPPYTEKAFELLQGMVRISSLAKGGDDKQDRRPVNPPLPKPNRWRQDTTPATFTAAAQANPKLKSL